MLYQYLSKISNYKNSNALIILCILVSIQPLMNGFYNYKLISSPISFWLQDIIFSCIVPLYLIYFILKHKLLSWDDLGLTVSKINLLRLILFTAILTPFTFFLFFFLESIVFTVFPFEVIYPKTRGVAAELLGQNEFNYKMMIPKNKPGKFVAAFYMAITAGFFEEVFYRAITYKICKVYKHGLKIYFIIPSFFFALLHWESGSQFLIIAFLYGIFNAIVYHEFKNLWPLIFVHFLYDFLVFMGMI